VDTVNEPLEMGSFSMASLIAKSALGKADLVVGRRDPWSRTAMDRRERWEHPLHQARVVRGHIGAPAA
jgi:hypothetical protein